MKTYVFLITLGFIQLVLCNHELNITDYDLNSVCPIHFFRRKRSYAEYTRWRANQDLTTNEFLVKVLDEDLTTPQTQKIVAVNILPVTAGVQKIIIGGAKVPSPTFPLTTTDALKDYTRFVVHPTTPRMRGGELFHAPIPPKMAFPGIPPPLQQIGINVVRNSQRDDSPPASPQFLPRTPMLMGHQYAPLASVAFNRRLDIAPVTPPSTNTFDQESESSHFIPTRTQSFSETTFPSRTTNQIDEFQKFHSFEEETLTLGDSEIITPSTYSIPDRTITPVEINMINDVEGEIESTTEQTMDKTGRRQEGGLKKVDEKDSEASYNLMLYSDEDNNNDVNAKKDDPDISDNYFDKKGNLEDSTEKVSLDSNTYEIEYIDSKNTTFIKDFTDKMSSFSVTGIPAAETVKAEGTKAMLDKPRPFCSLIKLRQLDFISPRTLPEIMSQLKQWAETSPVAKGVDITNGTLTTMENPIYMMIVDDPSSGQIVAAKRTVMIVAGIQGRDHHAVASAMYILYQLIERSEAHFELLSKYRFWIIPVLNPDGYDYSVTFPHRREWTKNLRQVWDTCKGQGSCKSCETHGLRCLIQQCYGVNLDRNFEYQWIPADELRAEHPCGVLYSGVRQLSELETRSLTQFLHGQRRPIYTFIAFKEGPTLGVMYPYSHTRKKRALDNVFRQRAFQAAAAAFSISNRPYVAGQTSEFLPLYAGGIEDWVDGHLGIDNTYAIMMFRPSDSYKSNLITEHVVHEAYAAMDTLLILSLESQGPSRPALLKRVGVHSSGTTLTQTHIATILSAVVLYG